MERGRGSCVWGRSPVGRCQPGQFKGAACAFCGEGRQHHTHHHDCNQRDLRRDRGRRRDIRWVHNNLLCLARLFRGVCRVVWRGNEQMLVAIYRTRQLLLEALSLKCFQPPEMPCKSSLRGLQHALLLMKPSFFVTLVSSRAPLHGHGDAC